MEANCNRGHVMEIPQTLEIKDKALLHPAVQEKLIVGIKLTEKAKGLGIISQEKDGLQNFADFSVWVIAEFNRFKERKGRRDAEIARRKKQEAYELAQKTASLHYKASLLSRTSGGVKNA